MAGVTDTLALADWRRRIAETYAAVRGSDDPEVAWRMWTKRRDQLFGVHSQSPLAGRTAPFNGLPYFAYTASLRFVVDVEAVDGSAVAWPAGQDGTVDAVPFARTVGLADTLGGELSVYWLAGYGGGVFLPFGDATNGGDTYGGGRYLLDGIKGADLGAVDGRLILDFNFAYNPSCAYSDKWICPLAPPQNRLTGAVTAGEKASA